MYTTVQGGVQIVVRIVVYKGVLQDGMTLGGPRHRWRQFGTMARISFYYCMLPND